MLDKIEKTVYNIASVFVLASYQEAFGAVTNEAAIKDICVQFLHEHKFSFLWDKYPGV